MQRGKRAEYTPWMPKELQSYDTLTHGGISQYGRDAHRDGGNDVRTGYNMHMTGGALGGAGLALMHELLRHKSDEEQEQPLSRKLLRVAGKGGLGALAGLGAGGLLQAIRSR